MNRIVNNIHSDFTKKTYFSAAFLDISQAFDNVCYMGFYINFSHTDAASENLQNSTNKIQNGYTDSEKSKLIQINSRNIWLETTACLQHSRKPQLPQADDIKYLSTHMDRRLT